MIIIKKSASNLICHLTSIQNFLISQHETNPDFSAFKKSFLPNQTLKVITFYAQRLSKVQRLWSYQILITLVCLIINLTALREDYKWRKVWCMIDQMKNNLSQEGKLYIFSKIFLKPCISDWFTEKYFPSDSSWSRFNLLSPSRESCCLLQLDLELKLMKVHFMTKQIMSWTIDQNKFLAKRSPSFFYHWKYLLNQLNFFGTETENSIFSENNSEIVFTLTIYFVAWCTEHPLKVCFWNSFFFNSKLISISGSFFNFNHHSINLVIINGQNVYKCTSLKG